MLLEPQKMEQKYRKLNNYFIRKDLIMMNAYLANKNQENISSTLISIMELLEL